MVLVPDISPLFITIPLIVSLIAGVRYVIGLRTWKNYPTLALSLSLFLILDLGNNVLPSITFWLLSLGAVIGGGIIVKLLLKKFILNFYARMALVYLGGIIVLMLFIFILNLFGLISSVANSTQFGISVFLIASTLDELATLQFKKDRQEFLRRMITTITLSLISGFLLWWPWWNSFASKHQELLLAILILDILVASWSFIRITEIIRFKAITKNRQ